MMQVCAAHTFPVKQIREWASLSMSGPIFGYALLPDFSAGHILHFRDLDGVVAF